MEKAFDEILKGMECHTSRRKSLFLLFGRVWEAAGVFAILIGLELLISHRI